MKRFLVFLFLLLGFATFLNPTSASDFPETNERFYIENYAVNIDVDKYKTANIVEEIDVYFAEPSHGIIRKIPFNKASVENIKVSEKNSVTHNYDSVEIKIGHSDKFIEGAHKYRISYKYRYLDNKNEFYHNIIGTDWSTYIKNASFDVTMPDIIVPDKVGISVGKYGESGFYGGAVYNVKDNKVTGYAERILYPYEGINIRIEVPEGYFQKYHNYFAIFMNILVIIAIVFLTTRAYKIWNEHGKDIPIIPVVSFYPPEGLNAAEMELAYNGEVTNKGIIALLIELASEGYIKIHQEGTNFTIEKVCKYDGPDKSKRDLFSGLFKKEKTKIISDEELKTSKTFYNKCDTIKTRLNSNKNKNKFVYENKHLVKEILLCIYGLTFCLIINASNYRLSTSVPPVIISAVIFAAILAASVVILISKSKTYIALWVFYLLPFLFGTGLVLYSMSEFSKITTVIGVIGLIISMVCLYQLPKRTDTQQQVLNTLTGLKKFINVAEKGRLEQLVEQTPEYFYSVLPAAYILGVSDKWIKNFESSVMVIQPAWYEGNFNSHSFDKITDDLQRYAKASYDNGGLSHDSSSDSGSSFRSSDGGGGRSGGGGGGGGGSSW